MNTLSEEQRKLLLEHHRAPCISLYLPTHQAGAEIQHDRIRLKQQTRQAENLLFLANVPAAQYRDHAATGRASNDVREVLPAAYDGRIESLFVSSEQ